MTGLIKRLFSKKRSAKQSTSSDEITTKVTSSDTGSSNTSYPNASCILKRDAHCVSRKKISNNALKVLYRLNEEGYDAYLVGGGVRDILLGLAPKDFDIATNATPEQIRALFRNCRLIGRRFRLAHILYGREVIEVATFRAGHDSTQADDKKDTAKKSSEKDKNEQARTSDHGMLVRDNVYGTMLEDAFRRDFTVNALYYTVRDFSVIDYTEGLEDLAARKLRLIGEPAERYREDPVRILRAIRLSCKLNLTIETKTAAPIEELSSLLSHVSSARLWEECNKMFLAGHAESTWISMCELGVARYMFEQTVESLESESNALQDNQTADFKRFILAALKNTDKRIANKQPITPAFLFAVFLWKPVLTLSDSLIRKGMPPYEAHQKAASKVMDKQRISTAIPKRFSTVVKEMWSLQSRLPNLRKKSVDSLISHQRFRAAYDFLCLRAGDDKALNELAKWWTDYQEAGTPLRIKMLKEASHQSQGRRSSKKKRPPNRKNITPSD